MSPLDQIFDQLADRIAARVLAKLAAPATHYTSNARGPYPPGKSRSWALKNLRHVPGAKKVGRDWVVPFEAWESWVTARDTERAQSGSKAPLRAVANDVGSTVAGAPDLDALADQVLLGSGYRRARSR